ncbi:hypothetical protein NLX65_02155 [Candidatus Cardinium sp. TP]|nr:hypothetical protein [Candidatus Cardinium sp. TP]
MHLSITTDYAMVSFSFSSLLVLAFLLLTLVVGLMGRKATTFREYAVDNKRLSTVKLLATLLGTSFCCLSFVYSVQACYSLGIRKMLPSIIDATSLWITSMFWVRMAPFMAHRSIAETIGSIYGTYPRIIVALLSICNAIFKVTFQSNVISSIVSTSMDAIHPDIIAVLAALVLIAYATLGGIRAITNTDVLQFITFVAIVFLLAKLMFVKTGKSVLEMVSFLQKQENFKLSSLCQSNGQLLNLLLSIPYCFFALSRPSVI